ncbi:TetR/AcrR family transcriptional regulator [Alkalibacter saccharofermentans]|uniref:Transcriptional regulator, TetR family n=1 Tax=Alkalibacter saccharofermentans DSM 14828 TaxID=1120975 RepID=A0A1M4TIC2_9FIRM|nr:TetR/AcrR family transcriptional regulator [Alkalibacter saccharofermentans]SHE44155.1 transcriptional regulator, TetR family [Alkalibacter saccharofermentans DSM 14828]
MPKETFYNLSEEKRMKIYQAALDEFSSHPYKQSSVNRIVQKSGIAKGSFYQYFEDKKDLYKYLIDEIYKRKISYLTPALKNPFEMNFFELLRDIYSSGIKFAKENPQLAKIGYYMLNDSGKEIYNEVLDEKKGDGMAIYKTMLELGMKRGDIRDDVNLDMAAYFLFQLGNSISNDFMEFFDTGEQDQVFNLVDGMIDMLKSGIENR